MCSNVRSNFLRICYYLLFSLPHNLIYVCFNHHKYFLKIKIRTVHKLYKRMFPTIPNFGFQDNSWFWNKTFTQFHAGLSLWLVYPYEKLMTEASLLIEFNLELDLELW